MAAASAPIEISARVLFVSQDRVLLANRRGHSWFYLPGGNVAPGETVEAALRRETREQSGIEVTDLEFIGCAENVYVERGVRYQEINVLFAADMPWGAQIGSWEMDVDMTSVTLQSLRSRDLRPASLRSVIEGWLRNRRPTWHGAPAAV